MIYQLFQWYLLSDISKCTLALYDTSFCISSNPLHNPFTQHVTFSNNSRFNFKSKMLRASIEMLKWNVQEGDVLRLGKKWIMLQVFSSLPIFNSGLSNFTISCRHVTMPKGLGCSVSWIYRISNLSRYIIRQPSRKFYIIIIHYFCARSTSLQFLLTHSARVVRQTSPVL